MNKVKPFQTLYIFRGLKTELVCEGEWEGATCSPLSSYSYSQLRSLEYTTENSWYPDLLFYWLAIWGCYLLAQQQTIRSIIPQSCTECEFFVCV